MSQTPEGMRDHVWISGGNLAAGPTRPVAGGGKCANVTSGSRAGHRMIDAEAAAPLVLESLWRRIQWNLPLIGPGECSPQT